MVTLRDVARAAGVSAATASRALSQPSRVPAERREQVEKAAAELGYQPTRGARPALQSSGRIRPGRSIGLVVPDMQNPFFGGIAKGVQYRARSAGLSVIVADSDEDPRLETQIVDQMIPQVEGMVLCSARMSDQALAARTARTVAPHIVLVNRESESLRSVVIDNEDGIVQAVRHLHALGHRRIAYAGGQWGSWSDRERRRGLERAAHSLPDVELVQLGHFATVFAGGVAAADLVAASGATAVVAHNDLVALGILDRLRSRGTLVPDQVSVVGFDDVPGATHVSPTLTTVSVPLQLLGRTAVDLLLDPERTMESALSGTHSGPQSSAQSSTRSGAQSAADPETDQSLALTLPVSLVVRDSTGPVATG